MTAPTTDAVAQARKLVARTLDEGMADEVETVRVLRALVSELEAAREVAKAARKWFPPKGSPLHRALAAYDKAVQP